MLISWYFYIHVALPRYDYQVPLGLGRQEWHTANEHHPIRLFLDLSDIERLAYWITTSSRVPLIKLIMRFKLSHYKDMMDVTGESYLPW